MTLSLKKIWIGTAAVLGMAVAGHAQAQPYVNVTVGAPLAHGVYGQIHFGPGTPPPLFSSQPRVVRRLANPEPAYFYVPRKHRTNWARYCDRYHACGRPVYFVDGDSMTRRPSRRPPRHAQPAPRRMHHPHDRHAPHMPPPPPAHRPHHDRHHGW